MHNVFYVVLNELQSRSKLWECNLEAPYLGGRQFGQIHARHLMNWTSFKNLHMTTNKWRVLPTEGPLMIWLKPESEAFLKKVHPTSWPPSQLCFAILSGVQILDIFLIAHFWFKVLYPLQKPQWNDNLLRLIGQSKVSLNSYLLAQFWKQRIEKHQYI